MHHEVWEYSHLHLKEIFLMKVKLFAAAVGVFGLVGVAMAACPLCA
jgi:hypothetical protein